MGGTIEISVIIPTFNRKELLKRCLESILGQEFDTDKYEIIVIDDGSADGTRELLKKLSLSNKKMVYSRQDRGGPASARNRGIAKARGDIIGFIDDDAVADRRWLVEAFKFFDEDKGKKIGGVEGRVVTCRPEMAPLSGRTDNPRGSLYRTCNMFYRKGILLDVGGFDKDFLDAFREDSDLAFAVLKRGYDIVYAPKSAVSHYTVITELTHPIQQAKKYYYDALLYKKHPRLYRQLIDQYQMSGFKFTGLRQRFYKLYVASSIFMFASLLFDHEIITRYLFLSTLMIYFAILAGYLRLQRLKEMSFTDILIGIPTALVIPYFYLYYLVKGMIRFKKIII